MKVGIIGFGKMGMLHGALLNSIPGVELVGIADTTKLVLKAFKSVLPNIKYFAEYQDLIDQCQLDAVIITTPTFSHVPIATYAAEKNIHFFVEKPLSLNVEQAEALYRIVLEKNVKAMIGFCARYYTSFIKAKEILINNQLGKIISVKAENYLSDVMRKEKGWRFNKNLSGGGVVIDYSVHMIDLLYWFFGMAKQVSAQTKQIYSESVEDEVNARFTFGNGIEAELNSSWSNPNYRKTYMKIEISGELGSMSVTDQTFSINYNDGSFEKLLYPDLYKGYYIDIAGVNYSAQMQKFNDYIMKDIPIDADITSGIAVQRMVHAIYQSSEYQKPIEITDRSI